jgi:hypothetical protein
LTLKHFLFLTSICIVLFFACHKNTSTIYDSFNSGLNNWLINDTSIWKGVNVDGDNIAHLQKPGNMGRIRAPKSIAIFNKRQVNDFELTVRAKCLTDTLNKRRDICFFFGYQDSAHYYYAHFSGISDKSHNIVAIVNNSDRKKINLEKPGESDAQITGPDWYSLKVTRDLKWEQ